MPAFVQGVPQFVWWLLLIAVLALVLAVARERPSIRAARLGAGGSSERKGGILSRILPLRFAPAEETIQATMTVPATRAALVALLHELAVARAEDAIRWYDANRGRKKRLGVGLRLTAIVVTAAAGLHPLLVQIFMWTQQSYASPVVPSIFVATAALLVLFDRFGGHTSGWMRYMKAQTSLDQALASYKASWLAERGIDAEPDPERADRLAQRSLRLIRHVDRTVRDETDEWVAEFRRALAESERAVEEARRRLDTGSIEVVVTNFAAIPGGRWTLQVGEGAERAIAGARAAETGIAIGAHQVRGTVSINGLVCQDERAVDVRPAAVSVVELTFPVPASIADAPGGNGARARAAAQPAVVLDADESSAPGNGQPAETAKVTDAEAADRVHEDDAAAAHAETVPDDTSGAAADAAADAESRDADIT